MSEFDGGGIDPQVKKYFKKILSSFSYGVLWMLAMSTAGLYFGLALIDEHLRWYNVLFYFLFLISILLLIRFFYKTWKDS